MIKASRFTANWRQRIEYANQFYDDPLTVNMLYQQMRIYTMNPTDHVRSNIELAVSDFETTALERRGKEW
jgi:hypothetical protein